MSVGQNQFSLYDFFSILLPGVVFLLGLWPFLPSTTGGFGIVTVLPLLAGGYVSGRLLHSIAVGVERQLPTVVSHRERFKQEMAALARGGELVKLDQKQLSRFCEECQEAFDLDFKFPVSRNDLRSELASDYSSQYPPENLGLVGKVREVIGLNPNIRSQNSVGLVTQFRYWLFPPQSELDAAVESELERRTNAVYTLARGLIHMDRRGRSRKFQAIFAFYRSVWISMIILSYAYYTYIVGIALAERGWHNIILFPYQPLIGSLTEIPIVVSYTSLAAFTAVVFIWFEEGKDQHRDYYLEYLISDLLVIRQLSQQPEPYNISFGRKDEE